VDHWRSRYEEEVGMLEKWENVKRTIKTMGKKLSIAFDESKRNG